jgi:outer membrane protein assembly factor BamB
VRGLSLQRTFCPGGTAFAFYGRDGASSRILLGYGRGEARYGFDFRNYVWPPRIQRGERAFVYEELVWAREGGGMLYVENAHLTYARSSYGQNAYITAIDVQTKKRLWRSKALVANAATFAVTPRYLLTGYGFTAESDWLYLLDRRTGRVVERLALPSGPEKITRSGPNFIVRTYDHVLTVRLQNS